MIQLSTEEVTAIQDRIIATTLPAGDSKSPIKVQGKEYSIESVNDDVLVAKSGVSHGLRLQDHWLFAEIVRQDAHIVASVTASLVLVILTETDNVEPIATIARNFTYVTLSLSSQPAS